MSVRVLFDHACARWRPWRSWRGRGEFTLLSVDVCGGVFSFRSDDVVDGREKKVKVKRREREREREVTDRTMEDLWISRGPSRGGERSSVLRDRHSFREKCLLSSFPLDDYLFCSPTLYLLLLTFPS